MIYSYSKLGDLATVQIPTQCAHIRPKHNDAGQPDHEKNAGKPEIYDSIDRRSGGTPGRSKKILVSKGFPENSVRVVFNPKKKDIASHIIEMAVNEKYDVIVINRKSGRVSRFFTGSVFSKVITALKDRIVCIVS
jgi:hypothetical protein